MRLFERLREKLGYQPVVLDATPETNKNTAAALASLVLEPTDSMCCGHCAGKAEGPSPEQSSA